TANATRSDIEKCLASGMNDYLAKPFTPDDLYSKLFRDMGIHPHGELAPIPVAAKKSSFDLGYLRSISANNEQFIQEMIQTFVQTIPPILSEMRTAATTENWQKLSRLAHQIKPTFSLLGMEDLRKVVFDIEERAAQRSDLAGLSTATERFVDDCSAVIDELARQLSVIGDQSMS